MIFLLILAGISAVEPFKWTSSVVIPTGSTISACTGSNVRFSWGYQTDPSEHVIDVEWSFEGTDKVRQTIASLLHGNFLVYPDIIQHIQFVPNSGLELLNVTEEDNGRYTIDININLHGAMVVQSQIVVLQVAEVPVFENNRLHAELLPDAVQDNVTNQWSALLRCGNFSSLGQPPVDVVWKSPTNQVLTTSFYDKGNFYLSIPSPPESGEYSCQLQQNPASQCLESNSRLHTSSVAIDPVQIENLILSGRLKAIRVENSALKKELQQTSSISEGQKHELQQLITKLSQGYPTCEQMSEQLGNITKLLSSESCPCEPTADPSLAENTVCFTIPTTVPPTTLSPDQIHRPENCKEVQEYDQQSGVHTLFINNTSFTAYCDQTIDGGGWTVIHKRFDGSVEFNHSWYSFEDGFGDKYGEYWLGLSNMHVLTSSGDYILRVDIQAFNGSRAYAVYDHFRVDGADTNYTLHVTGYSGTAGDSLEYPRRSDDWANGMQFSTYDRDNDRSHDHNCAEAYWAGWWHNACADANPNGIYHHNSLYHRDVGMMWYSWNGLHANKAIDMKVRPKQ